MDDSQPPPAVEHRTVDGEGAGQRIDNYLLRVFKGVPKSHVYKLLRRGEVRVNRGRVRPEYRLRSGDRIRLPPVRRGTQPGDARPGPGPIRRIEAGVLYESDDVLVLDKPAGMAVHGGSGLSFGVIEALRASRADAAFLELAHRLDRETSGCLVIAKRRSALRRVHAALRARTVKKRYLALVAGRWPRPERVALPLSKGAVRGGERIVRVDEAGQPSVSDFRPLDRCTLATLVEVGLHTGRTHQIRVHAAAAGHPVAGDERYGDSAFNSTVRVLGLRRLFLHAASIEFDPGGGPLLVRAPLPSDLARVLAALGLGRR